MRGGGLVSGGNFAYVHLEETHIQDNFLTERILRVP